MQCKGVHGGKGKEGRQQASTRHSTSSLCCPASLSSIVSSIVCLLIRLRVADRLTSLESSLKVSRAFLIVASFRAMASRKAAGGGGNEGWRYERWYEVWRGWYEGWRI